MLSSRRTLPALLRPVHAEVPFADRGGVVAVLLQQRGDGHPARLDQARAQAAEHAALAVAIRQA